MNMSVIKLTFNPERRYCSLTSSTPFIELKFRLYRYSFFEVGDDRDGAPQIFGDDFAFLETVGFSEGISRIE
jgi:hypothetical protein